MIAKELGVSRNTVRAGLDAETPPHYTRPPRPNPKLAPYLKQIEAMAVEQHLIGSRIIRELRLLGYDGGTTPVYEYLRDIKQAANKPSSTGRSIPSCWAMCRPRSWCSG